MNPGELEVLVALVKSVNPVRVIEFGCNVGRTAKVILREVKSIESYVGVDVNPGYKYDCEVQKNETPNNPGVMVRDDWRFKLMLSDRGTFDLTKKDLWSADVVFIDGDHSYVAVKHDTQLAFDIIADGGIVIWHDYHTIPTVDVRKVVEEIATQRSLNIQYVEGTWFAFYRYNKMHTGV